MMRIKALWSLAVVVMVLVVAVPLAAQTVEGTVIAIGETKAAVVSAGSPTAVFVVESGAPQAINVQALASTSGLVPRFRVVDPSGITIQAIDNTAAAPIVQANVNLMIGSYRIEVQSANQMDGEVVLTVQNGTPVPPPSTLAVGQGAPGTVSPQETLQAYTFDSSMQEVLVLSVNSDLPSPGIVVALKDATSAETLSVSNMRLIGVRWRIPVGAVSYRIEVMHSGSGNAEPYTVCLEPENGSNGCTGGVFAIPTATLPPLVCSAVATGGTPVNVRSGPGVNYPATTTLAGTTSAEIIGRLGDGTWWQINVGGVIGWVSAPFVTTTGDCSIVPVTSAPPSPVPPPTAAPTATQPPPPTATLPLPTLIPLPTVTVGMVVTFNPGVLTLIAPNDILVNPSFQINPVFISTATPAP